MKKLLVVLLSLLMILALAACQNQGGGQEEGGEEETNYTIGASIMTSSYDFQDQMAKGITRAAQEHGYTAVINEYEGDTERMLTGLDTMYNQGVRGMYGLFIAQDVAIDWAKAHPDVAIITQGAPMEGGQGYTVNDYVTLGKQFVDSLDAFVKEKGITSGDVAGLWLTTCENKDSDYYQAMLDIRGEIEKWCDQMGEGFDIVCDYYPVDAEDTANITDQILNAYPDVKFVFDFNNTSAIACANEIDSAVADNSEYFVFSSEGDPETFRLIASGTSSYRGCAYADIEASGYAVGMRLIEWLEKGTCGDVTVEKVLVDARNVNDYLK